MEAAHRAACQQPVQFFQASGLIRGIDGKSIGQIDQLDQEWKKAAHIHVECRLFHGTGTLFPGHSL